MTTLFEVLNSGQDAEESLRLFRDEQQRREQQRRLLFQQLGADPECGLPASRIYHDQSRLFHDSVLPLTSDQVRELTRTLDYKRYPAAPRVPLGPPEAPLELRLGEALAARRSARHFGKEPMSKGFLSTCLGLGCGVTDARHVPPRRSSPSAGALYPVEVYPLVLHVDGVERGLYHYDPLAHELERVRAGTGPEELWPILCQGLWGVRPALALFLTARLPRVQKKYGERGYRFALLECGHTAQSFNLIATAARLSVISLGGFVDDEMNRFLGIDGRDEVGLYAVLMGSRLLPAEERESET